MTFQKNFTDKRTCCVVSYNVFNMKSIQQQQLTHHRAGYQFSSTTVSCHEYLCTQ